MSKEKGKPAEKQLRMKELFFPAEVNLEARYERALGRLTNNFSLLHFFLERFSWRDWGLKAPYGAVLTRDLPTKQLVIKLRDSAEHAIARKADQEQFKVLLKRVEKAAEQRNDLLHSLWLITEGQVVSCVNRKRGLLEGENAPSVDDINKINRSIIEIAHAFMEFMKRDPLKTPTALSLGQLHPDDGA